MTRVTTKAAGDRITSADVNAIINKIQTTNATNVDNDVVFPRYFNVKNYGATGGGLVSDSTAISLALSAASSAGGGVVYFPKGRYLAYRRALPPSNVAIIGDGRGRTTIVCTSTFAIPSGTLNGHTGVFAINDAASSSASHIFIGDMTIDVTRATASVLAIHQGYAPINDLHF